MRFWLFIISTLLLTACQPSDKAEVDKLNSHSYACHYRNLDSTALYVRQVLDMSGSYTSGRAEALNHLAFVQMAKMDYQQAESTLNDISELTDNQVELLVCYVQQMRLCQRRSRNKAFHDFRERAITCMKRIDEERNQLDTRQQQRLRYAETELGIANTTHY